jgi:hypothetical protein
VQQRPGGVLERDRAQREQPLDRPLTRERRPRLSGPLGRELLIQALNVQGRGVVVARRTVARSSV